MMSPSEFKTCKVIENRLFIKACDSDTDLVVFDEVLDLIDYGILDEQMLLYYLDNRGNTEVVLTGRNPGLKVKKRADCEKKVQRLICCWLPASFSLPYFRSGRF